MEEKFHIKCVIVVLPRAQDPNRKLVGRQEGHKGGIWVTSGSILSISCTQVPFVTLVPSLTSVTLGILLPIWNILGTIWVTSGISNQPRRRKSYIGVASDPVRSHHL